MHLHVLLSTVFVSIAEGRTFHIGVMIPYSGEWSAVSSSALHAVQYVLEQVNSDTHLTHLRAGGHQFTFHWRDTGCQQAMGLEALVDLWALPHSIDALIGKMG